MLWLNHGSLLFDLMILDGMCLSRHLKRCCLNVFQMSFMLDLLSAIS